MSNAYKEKSMKVLLMIVISVLIFSTGSVFADFQGPGAMNADTVAHAEKLADDASVTLEGHVVKQTSYKNYLFRDKTGEVHVEIADDVWRGQVVKPETRVRLTGKIDRDHDGIEIEVYRIDILTKE